MNNFKISPVFAWYTEPITNTRQRGKFIFHEIDAYYHDDYHGGNAEKRETIGTVENIITTLKNQFQDRSNESLVMAQSNLIKILMKDLQQILEKTGKKNLTVCVIPRAKAEKNYSTNQLIFKQAIKTAVDKLNGFSDGTAYITRHKDTRTTHLDRAGYGGEGDLPYPGITKDTCTISADVKGKDVLLIDDLYTETVNIDEDAIQALLDNGANSVTFYSIGKTLQKNK